jgi:molybdenum cofactor biosynthesis protein B
MEIPSGQLTIAVLTVSDTREKADDTSGELLIRLAHEAGHHVADRELVPDDVYRLRAVVSRWIADPRIQVVIANGGTGITGRDVTPSAIRPLLDKEIEGFGELFRMISYQEIGTSSLQSRAFAGVANATVIFCVPGSPNACETAWTRLIRYQLDIDHKPCNLVQLFPRLLER